MRGNVIRFIGQVIVLASLGTVVGCSVHGADEPTLIKELNTERASQYAYIKETPRRGSAVTQPPERVYFRDAYNSPPASKTKRDVRDEILYDLMSIVDANYRQFEDNLRTDRTVKDLSVTLATLGLTSAATIFGGEETKTILSAIATGVVGANAAVDKQVFKDYATEALIPEMRALRNDIATNMIANMKTQDVDKYPLDAGLRDIVDYYHAGSVTAALQGLVTRSSNAQADTKAIKAEVQNATDTPGVKAALEKRKK